MPAYLFLTCMVLGIVRLARNAAVGLQIGLFTRAAGPQLVGAASAAHHEEKCADRQ
jgi:hypothetical protein